MCLQTQTGSNIIHVLKHKLKQYETTIKCKWWKHEKYFNWIFWNYLFIFILVNYSSTWIFWPAIFINLEMTTHCLNKYPGQHIVPQKLDLHNKQSILDILDIKRCAPKQCNVWQIFQANPTVVFHSCGRDSGPPTELDTICFLVP